MLIHHIGRGKDSTIACAYARDGGYIGTETEFAAKLAKEVPIKTSELINDSDFPTAADKIEMVTLVVEALLFVE